MSVTIVKYIRNKKIKIQAKERNKIRILYIQHDLAANDVNIDSNSNYPTANTIVSLLPTIQSTIVFINNAVNFLSYNRTIIAPSSSL